MKNKRVESKFSECPDFSSSRTDSALEPVTSSFPAATESLQVNSQSSAVVQPVRTLTRSFSPVTVQSGQASCHNTSYEISHRKTTLENLTGAIIATNIK